LLIFISQTEAIASKTADINTAKKANEQTI